jgi:AMMECR1 domain-containing protein
VTADRTALYSIDDLTKARQHVNAVLASGVLDQHERSHLLEVKTRIDAAVTLKQQEEPRPLRGSAGVPTA